MASTSGPRITRSGLTSKYDVSNERSFRGLTATNLTYGIFNSYSNTNDTFFKVNYGTESAFIPYFGQSLNVKYVDIYNEYNNGVNGNNNCCPAPFYFHSSNIPVQGNTTYMYQIIFKTDTGYYHPNYMYRYEYSNSGYISEAGLVNASRLESLGDGWFHAWGSFTTNASTTILYCYLFHYEYTTWNRIRVADVSITQGSLVHRPEHMLNLDFRASRGNTFALGGGLSDLVGSYNMDFFNGISFTASNGGSLYFDGSDDYATIPAGTLPNGSCSVEILFQHSHNLIGSVYFVSTTGSLAGYQIYFRGDWAGDLFYFLRFTSGSSNYGDSAWGYTTGIRQSVPANTLTHIIFTHDVSTDTMKVYVNGNLTRTINAAVNAATGLATGYGSLPSSNVNHILGALSNATGALRMNLHLFKVYNKALSDSEALNNYNSVRTRMVNTTTRSTRVKRRSIISLGDGLFSSVSFLLDPANKNCFPSTTSHIMYDLSPNSRKVTFYNQGGSTFYLNPPGPPGFSTEAGGVLVFDGVNDFGIMSSILTLGSDVTFSVWVKTTTTGRGLFSHCSGGPVNVGYGIESNVMSYRYYTNTWYTSYGTTSVIDGSWNNLVWVKSGTNMKFYINGTLDKDETLVGGSANGNMRSIGSFWGPCASSNGVWPPAGYGVGNDSYGTVFNGSMGPFIVWSRSLSSSEVSQLFNNYRARFRK